MVTEGKHGKKYRLIHDLRRSRVNALLKLRERLVLPRLADVIDSILDLLALMPVSGDEGARTLMRHRPEMVEAIVVDGDEADVDTLEDLRRWS